MLDDKDVERLACELPGAAHPTRLRLVQALTSTREAHSPSGAAGLLSGLSLGTVAYHMRRLRDAGLLNLVRTAQRRGALEHYYATTERARRLATQLELTS
jgi:DNA-binding transcriptional ArsR family regulator